MAEHFPRGLSREEFRAWARKSWEEGLAASPPVDPSQLGAAKRADHPHLTRTGCSLHLLDGAWVSVDREGELRTGRVRGLRADALAIDIDRRTWLTNRRDGVPWPTDVDTVSIPEQTIEVVARPADSPEQGGSGDTEIWSIRTAWFQEDL